MLKPFLRGWVGICTLLCGISSVTFAAGVAAPNDVRQVPVSRFQGQQIQAGTGEPAHRRPGGLNQQVKPASSRNKILAEPDRDGSDVYIVRLHDLPVATYDGRIKGYTSTREALPRAAALKGASRTVTAAVSSYRQYLQGRQTGALAAMRAKGINAAVRGRFTDAINGFTDLAHAAAGARRRGAAASRFRTALDVARHGDRSRS